MGKVANFNQKATYVNGRKNCAISNKINIVSDNKKTMKMTVAKSPKDL